MAILLLTGAEGSCQRGVRGEGLWELGGPPNNKKRGNGGCKEAAINHLRSGNAIRKTVRVFIATGQ